MPSQSVSNSPAAVHAAVLELHRQPERRVERVVEAVAAPDRVPVTALHLGERRERELGRERHRAARSGGRQRAVVHDLDERGAAAA